MTFTAVAPYADATYATAFLTSEYPALLTAWTALGATVQTQYLRKAADKIDALPLVGWKSVSTQSREFPRGGDTTTPDQVLRANVLIALVVQYHESGMTAIADILTIANKDVIAESMGDVSFTYSSGSLSDWLARGYPAEAMELLRYWVRSPRSISLGRM